MSTTKCQVQRVTGGTTPDQCRLENRLLPELEYDCPGHDFPGEGHRAPEAGHLPSEANGLPPGRVL